MGNEESSQLDMTTCIRPYSKDIYNQIGGGRFIPERGFDYEIDADYQKSQASFTQNIYKAPYPCIWSTWYPKKITPEPRTGHFYVMDEEKRVVYIGNGIADSGDILFDLWKLNLNTLEWEAINLTGDQLIARSGSKAVIYNNILIVFGGYSGSQYLNDMYYVNLATGEVKIAQIEGDLPTGRSSPIFNIVGNKIYCFGGFDGKWVNELCIFELASLKWTIIPTEIQGRTNVPSVVYGTQIYSYGCSKAGGILVIETETNEVKIVQTSGPSPPSTGLGSGMVLIESYLVYYGGTSDYSGSLMYIFNIPARKWAVLHICPDGDTTSYDDGVITSQGLFMIPKFQSFGTVYDRIKRRIVAFLGQPYSNAHNIQKFELAEAIAHQNVQEDLLHMLHNH